MLLDALLRMTMGTAWCRRLPRLYFFQMKNGQRGELTWQRGDKKIF
jgi:hypothetical protein